jgi:hypothetical protein
MGHLTGYAADPAEFHLATISKSSKVSYPPPPPTAEEKQQDWIASIQASYSADAELAKLQKRKLLVFNNDGLYYHTKKQESIYLPKALRLQCLEELHDTPYSGHKGTAKTMAAVTRLYWWPGITKDIAKYVRACILCQRNKASNSKPAGLLQPLPVPDDRWSEVTMDFITGFPCTPRGYDAVMVICDRLTKMVRFAPCTKDTDTTAVAKLFIKHVFANHGLPDVIISDRDTRFTSHLWQDLQQQLGTSHKLSTAFHPQTDGQTERVNRVLEEYLRHYVNDSQTDWDEWLPLAGFAYNNSWHEAIGTTPFHLNYGKAPKLPGSPNGPARFPVVDEIVSHITDVVARAKKRLQAAGQRAKAYADKHRSEIRLKLGQEVLLSTKFLQLKVPGVNKLLPKYVGPFTIKEVLTDVTYKLDLPQSMKVHPVFHLSLLRPYHQDGRHQPPPLPFEIDEEEGLWYEIDTILDHRVTTKGQKRVLQYLVKFKNCDAAHNQWCDAVGVTQLAKNEYHQRTNTLPPAGNRRTVPATSVATRPAPQTPARRTPPTPIPSPPAQTVTRSGRRVQKKVRF